MQIKDVFVCDAIRTPFGRYGGALSTMRTDDLAAVPIRGLMERNRRVDWDAVDDVIYGCANQAGEDNRNVGRMAALLAGLGAGTPATTINRLCGSSLDAIAIGARAIKTGEANLIVAGGVESMSRAPLVIPKAESAFSRAATIYDTTIGWRFINPKIQEQYGTDSMPETAENVAAQFKISREDQDAFAYRSQARYRTAKEKGFFRSEILAFSVGGKQGEKKVVNADEQPRPETTLEALAGLKAIVRPGGSVTAGNASGINDGAGALILASVEACTRYQLKPRARILASTVVGIEPRIMGFAPARAIGKILAQTQLNLSTMEVIEINEAFAAQVLAVTRAVGLNDDDPRVNPNGGAIAVGHPLGASGVRLVMTAVRQLEVTRKRFALCTMCIGVGQGIATVLERASTGQAEEEPSVEYEHAPYKEASSGERKRRLVATAGREVSGD
jgi:acetyl-CoA acyltransferase